jgi:hypothetical protein
VCSADVGDKPCEHGSLTGRIVHAFSSMHQYLVVGPLTRRRDS